MKVLGFCGSLRKASVNRKVLNIAASILKEVGHEFEEFDLRVNELPFYNQDIEDAGLPAVVVQMKQAVVQADAVLLACPEYNHAVSGVFKNMIDWASRPSGDNSFDGKKVLIVGASPGRLGSARAQAELRKILAALNADVVAEPQVCISGAYDAFDEQAQFKDESNLKLLADLVSKL